MIDIRVRSAADAQAVFDTFNGRGVTWRNACTSHGWHQIIVQDCTYADAVALLDALHIHATIREF